MKLCNCTKLLPWIFMSVIFLLIQTGAGKPDHPPNFVIILADDLGWNDVGWHNKDVITPHLNQLLKEGIELDQHYVQPVCTPSRFSLMTGKYPFLNGFQSGVALPSAPECVSRDIPMLPEKLKELGYATHLSGKWHLGFCDEGCTPNGRGFDSFYGFYNGMVDHYEHTIGLGNEPGYDWRNNSKVDRTNIGTHTTPLIKNKALDVISKHPEDTPLFLYVAMAAVHLPFQVDQKWYDMYPNEEIKERRIIRAMMTEMDFAVHEIVEKLKEKNMMENTVLLFLSDNGGEHPYGSNLPLRGAKGSYYEGGIRSASFIYSPLLPKTGYKNTQLIHVSDWMPTFLALAGGVDTQDINGVDQSRMLFLGEDSNRDHIPINFDDRFPQEYGYQAMRYGKFKLIRGYPGIADGYGDEAYIGWKDCRRDIIEDGFDNKKKRGYILTKSQKAKLRQCVAESQNDLRLFNVMDDPAEKHNLAYSPQYADVLDTIMEKMDQYETLIKPAPAVFFDKWPASMPNKWDWTWSPGWCPNMY